jgi:hypothetical protein
VIEKGAQVRVKLIGLRSDVGSMYAIGSIKEDYLGSVWSSSHTEITCAKLLQQCATAVNELASPNTTCECTLRQGIWKALGVGCVAPLLQTIIWTFGCLEEDNTVRDCAINTKANRNQTTQISRRRWYHTSQNDIKDTTHPAFKVIITRNIA